MLDEAISMIDAINEDADTRRELGIGQAVHAKLLNIRALLERGCAKSPASPAVTTQRRMEYICDLLSREINRPLVDRDGEWTIGALLRELQTQEPSFRPVLETEKLVNNFANALLVKLAKAEIKYGYNDEWLTSDWEAVCKSELARHVAKGDPLDVAAYAAFCWARGWTTAPPEEQADDAVVRVKNELRGDYTDAGMEDAFFRWPEIERAIGAALQSTAQPTAADLDEYVIRKGGYYYRPNAEGYTPCARQAGRYSLADAISLTHPNGPDGPRDGLSYMPAPELNKSAIDPANSTQGLATPADAVERIVSKWLPDFETKSPEVRAVSLRAAIEEALCLQPLAMEEEIVGHWHYLTGQPSGVFMPDPVDDESHKHGWRSYPLYRKQFPVLPTMAGDYVMVPREPNEAMLSAVEAVDFGTDDERAMACNVWNTMVAASPTGVE